MELEKFILIMTKINKKKVEEFIRVDHAGERGAVKIYEGPVSYTHLTLPTPPYV